MPKLEFHKKLGCFRYKCAECDFKTSLKLAFVLHKEKSKHTKFKLKSEQASKLTCAKCDFKTSMTYNLKNHMKNTKGVIPIGIEIESLILYKGVLKPFKIYLLLNGTSIY